MNKSFGLLIAAALAVAIAGCSGIHVEAQGSSGTGSVNASGTVHVERALSGTTATSVRPMIGVGRIAGGDRYATSVAVSKAEFPGTAPVVYIASGANYPDALAAGPAAAKSGGPLLLTTPYEVPGDVVAEVQRLHPSSILVVGGPFPIWDAALDQLRAAVPGATVARVAGDDRFATSRALVSGAFTTASTVYVASGNTFPDALTAGGAAGAQGAPILLVDANAPRVDTATASLLSSLKAKNVKVIGGTDAMSTGMVASLTDAGYMVTRLAGSDRYGTALAVNTDAYTHATTALLATGFGFPDALSATTLAGSTSSPLYLAPYDCVPRGVLADFTRLGVTTVTLVGGPAMLSASAESLTPCTW
ncbi:cell wall-binding repeat-containing protein [Leifsonia sp. fls2-241-R2A-40a]|uniref:cell wall-binding repeat-containing protein n=1 Tax=Leifsonia sp. fls2-241-R2A-40a TaxID=3040290 RepID=UPI00254C89F6|nr:cell wall-binding repeat-containing protein [Leifsonia sp. fls2-241-R2A-40a]